MDKFLCILFVTASLVVACRGAAVKTFWQTVDGDEDNSVVLPCSGEIEKNETYIIKWHRGTPQDGFALADKNTAGSIRILQGTNYTDRLNLHFSEQLEPSSSPASGYALVDANLEIKSLLIADTGNFSCEVTALSDDTQVATSYVFLNVTENKPASVVTAASGDPVSLTMATLSTLASLPVLTPFVVLGKAAFTGEGLSARTVRRVLYGLFSFLLPVSAALLWADYSLSLEKDSTSSKGHTKWVGIAFFIMGMTAVIPWIIILCRTSKKDKCAKVGTPV